MTRLLLPLAVVSGILLPISVFAQSPACTAHPDDPALTIAACTPVIKQIRHTQSKCHDEMVWAASTRAESIPYLPATMTSMSPECSGYIPPPPLYGHRPNPLRVAESHRILTAVPGYEPPPDPSLGEALFLRADAYLATRRFESAIDDYDAAAKLNPPDAVLFYHRAHAYHGFNNESHAVDDFSASLRLDDSNPIVWAGRCRSRAILGKLPQALADCDRSLELLSANATAYKARGLVNLKRHDYSMAIADYTTAIRLSGPTPVSLYGRGLAKRVSGDSQGAAADISAALQLNRLVTAIFKRYRIHLK